MSSSGHCSPTTVTTAVGEGVIGQQISYSTRPTSSGQEGKEWLVAAGQ